MLLGAGAMAAAVAWAVVTWLAAHWWVLVLLAAVAAGAGPGGGTGTSSNERGPGYSSKRCATPFRSWTPCTTGTSSTRYAT